MLSPAAPPASARFILPDSPPPAAARAELRMNPGNLLNVCEHLCARRRTALELRDDDSEAEAPRLDDAASFLFLPPFLPSFLGSFPPACCVPQLLGNGG